MIINTNLPKKKKLPKKNKQTKKVKKKVSRFKTPSYEEVEDMVISMNSPLHPAYIFGFFRYRNWCYPDGTKVKSLRDMILYLTRIFYSNYGLPPTKPINYKPKEEKIPYSEQLKDPRWFAFREKVFKVRGRKCEHCGSTVWLQVHHPKYKYGRKAWEYSTDEVVVLCRECHKKEHNITDND